MRGSIRLGSLAGIGVYMHWTFWLLIGWVLISSLSGGESLVESLISVAFIATLFGCIVLHELGHALAARRYGIPTRDIALLPIGGVARLARMPEKPLQELFVALAGPAVNVVIAAALFALLFAAGASLVPQNMVLSKNFLANLMWVNIILIAFNMLPAFPMDGGRVLRAVLGMFTSFEQATKIAARVGQGFAVLLGLAGLFVLNNPFMLVIALFVFLGAAGEAQSVVLRGKLRGFTCRDAMITRFQKLPGYLTLGQVAGDVLAGPQREFPVQVDGQFVGMLRRKDLLAALKNGQEQSPIVETMETDFATLDADTPLADAFQKATETGQPVIAITQNEELVGLLDTTNALEVVQTRSRLGMLGQGDERARALNRSWF